MEYETVKGRGKLGIELDEMRGFGARITRDFLSELLRSVIVRSARYYEKIQETAEPEHVFTYRERQLHSVVCPSIADITDNFLIEHPIRRKPSGEAEYTGNVDYWIYYKNCSFLMELKHTYFAYSTAEKPRKTIARKFERALEQLEEIKDCRDLAFGKGLRKIALEAIVFYKGSKEKERLKVDAENRDFRELFKRLVKNAQFRHKPNLRALWILDERLVEPYRYEKTFEIYPAVAFVGRVSKLIRAQKE